VSVSPWVNLLGQARVAARRGDWAQAVDLYQRVLALAPDPLEALEGLGVAALEQEQPARAVEWLTRARRRGADGARLWGLLARAQRESGAPADAIASSEKALAHEPRNAAFWLELARAQLDASRPEAALASAVRAIEIERDSAVAWCMSSRALAALGRLPEALHAVRQALARDPRRGEAHLVEGALLERSAGASAAMTSFAVAALLPETGAAGREQLERVAALAHTPGAELEAEAALALALAREPGSETEVDAAIALARRARQQQRAASAVVCYEHALRSRVDASLRRELAEALWSIGQGERAQAQLLEALEAGPDVEMYRLLGEWLANDLRFDAGEAAWQRLLAACPEDVVALVNLGVAAQRMGRPSEATRLHRRAIGLRPDLIQPYINLAAASCDQGLLAQANAAHQQALAIEPQRWAVRSNMLVNAHFEAHINPEALLAQHRELGQALSELVGPVRLEHSNARDPERRLRIGYVSPDLNEHPVSHFLEPVLREHDRGAFEIYCYSDVQRPDAVTARLRHYPNVYRACAGVDDEALAERIRADQIDILVDLAGHGLNNRMAVFARKPSPVQVTWLGYFDTTGLTAMDYRIGDVHSIPSGAERYFVERVVRLPRSATCFLPRQSPEISPPPSASSGRVTFGCFSNPAKINRDTAAVFGRILRGVPGSVLRLKYHTFRDPGVIGRFERWFAEEGIARDRLQFQGFTPLEQYLAAYGEIDIALDPFPYSGETTALHALWMGVPIVCLEGRTVVERLASRVLRVAALDDWVARSIDEYVRIALRLASNPVALAHARHGLRDLLRATPLLDHRGVTRDLEAAYRSMWRTWCASAGSSAERSAPEHTLGQSLAAGAL
jgi:predicted O-linked N-acetylglucosamine transferase (SPINDLY family)